MKLMKNISQLLIAVSLSLNCSAQVPTNGLVSSYPFTGNSNDASGNGNNLTPFNGPTLTMDRFGNPNSAYFFDGVNDYFTAPNPGPLLAKSRSIAFWAKTTANFNTDGYTVLNYGDPNGSGARFEVGLNSGCNGLYLDTGNGYASATYSNSVDNSWHFYAVCYDSTVSNQLSVVKYYVDAVMTNSFCVQPWPQYINTVNNMPINIGRFNPSFPRYFSGCLDDIRVFNRPLSQSEVTALFNETTVGIKTNKEENPELSVSPNPCATEIKVSGLKSDLTAQIFNSGGELILTVDVKTGSPTLNLKDIATGVYFLKLNDGTRVLTKKLIKE